MTGLCCRCKNCPGFILCQIIFYRNFIFINF